MIPRFYLTHLDCLRVKYSLGVLVSTQQILVEKERTEEVETSLQIVRNCKETLFTNSSFGWGSLLIVKMIQVRV